jgi:hypothetical protein
VLKDGAAPPPLRAADNFEAICHDILRITVGKA